MLIASSSLPLNRPRRLAGHVVHHAVNALHLIHDAAGDGLQHLVWQGDPVGGHAVFGVHRANGDCVRVGAHVTHHAYRHYRQEHRERLPDLVVHSGALDFADDNVVGFLQQGPALGSHLAQDAHRQSRPGKRLTLQDLFRHAQVAADLAHFVLEQVFEWLDQLELHEVGQAADIVMALDGLRRPAHRARLDHVGIQRALHQPIDFAVQLLDAVRLFLEDRDELVADDLALLLRLADAGQLAEEAFAGVHRVNIEAEFLAQVLLHGDELVLPQHTIVDEDAGQLIANRAMHQFGCNRGIHAARQTANHAALTDRLANAGDGLFDETLRSPVRREPADFEREVAQDFGALRRVMHFGMKLHRVIFLRGILNGSDGV